MTPAQLHQAELRRLQERVEILEEENRQLRQELGMELEGAKLDLLRRSLRLSLQEARLVLRLFNAGGRVVSRSQLIAAAPPVNEVDRDETKLLGAVVCHIRAKLGSAFVETHRAQGYSLPPHALAAVRRALGEEEAKAA